MGQIPTRRVSFRRIMARPAFALGVADVRAGKLHRPDYDSWPDSDDQWDYERGRQWATVTPRSVRLKRDGKITAEAWHWAVHHGGDIL